MKVIRNMRILYIEDEPNDAQLVALYLNTTSHHLTIVDNIQEARGKFADQPDLILVDLLIGHARDGYKLAQEFRAQGYKKPLVAVTALSTPKDVQDCRSAGFDFVLHKPFGIEQLADVIEKYTG